MKMKLITALLLLTSPCLADTGVLFNTFGGGTGPTTASLTLVMHPDENQNLFMSALANDPAGVKTITIIGNGRVIATCPKAVCQFVWARTAMLSGSNTVTLQVVNSARVQRQVRWQVNQPSAP